MKGVVKGKMTRQVYARLQDYAKWCRNFFADLYLKEGGPPPTNSFSQKMFFPKIYFLTGIWDILREQAFCRTPTFLLSLPYGRYGALCITSYLCFHLLIFHR